MNEIVHKLLLAGDEFMPEIYLGQPAALGKTRSICTPCGSFTKNK